MVEGNWVERLLKRDCSERKNERKEIVRAGKWSEREMIEKVERDTRVRWEQIKKIKLKEKLSS